MEITNFEDRIPTHPGRKKLTIVSQTADTMIVDETLADAPTQEGTKINANVMTKLQQGIIDAIAKSDNAVTTANNATQTASFAEEKALEALDQVVEKMGTKVFIANNTSPETRIDFSSAPQAQLNNQNEQITNIKNNTTLIANDNGGFSCGSGATYSSGLQFKSYTLCDANGKVPVARLVDAIYPVGSIYMSVNSTSPASLFGGTWAQLKDRFLLGSGDLYSLNTTGGTSTHTLSISEMPTHAHGLSSCSNTTANDDYNWVKPFGNTAGGGSVATKCVAELSTSGVNASRHVETYGYNNQAMSSKGNSTAHNNMPPYLVVNMWERVN